VRDEARKYRKRRGKAKKRREHNKEINKQVFSIATIHYYKMMPTH
jgi:hypothetical protein